jgi:hypothetical protein
MKSLKIRYRFVDVSEERTVSIFKVREQAKPSTATSSKQREAVIWSLVQVSTWRATQKYPT